MSHLACDGIADPLDDLHDDDQNDHDRHEHAGFVPVIAVLDGHVADAARADGADHCGVADQRDDGEHHAADERRQRLREHRFADDLPGGGTGGDGRLQKARIDFGKRAFRDSGEERHRGDRQGDRAAGRRVRVAEQELRNRDEHDHENHGSDRMALTMNPTMVLTTRFGLNRRFSVKYSNSAIRVPSTTPMMAEMTTIYAVSNSA